MYNHCIRIQHDIKHWSEKWNKKKAPLQLLGERPSQKPIYFKPLLGFTMIQRLLDDDHFLSSSEVTTF